MSEEKKCPKCGEKMIYYPGRRSFGKTGKYICNCKDSEGEKVPASGEKCRTCEAWNPEEFASECEDMYNGIRPLRCEKLPEPSENNEIFNDPMFDDEGCPRDEKPPEPLLPTSLQDRIVDKYKSCQWIKDKKAKLYPSSYPIPKKESKHSEPDDLKDIFEDFDSFLSYLESVREAEQKGIIRGVIPKSACLIEEAKNKWGKDGYRRKFWKEKWEARSK